MAYIFERKRVFTSRAVLAMSEILRDIVAIIVASPTSDGSTWHI